MTPTNVHLSAPHTRVQGIVDEKKMKAVESRPKLNVLVEEEKGFIGRTSQNTITDILSCDSQNTPVIPHSQRKGLSSNMPSKLLRVTQVFSGFPTCKPVLIQCQFTQYLQRVGENRSSLSFKILN